jgi:hypothetical protein
MRSPLIQKEWLENNGRDYEKYEWHPYREFVIELGKKRGYSLLKKLVKVPINN